MNYGTKTREKKKHDNTIFIPYLSCIHVYSYFFLLICICISNNVKCVLVRYKNKIVRQHQQIIIFIHMVILYVSINENSVLILIFSSGTQVVGYSYCSTICESGLPWSAPFPFPVEADVGQFR